MADEEDLLGAVDGIDEEEEDEAEAQAGGFPLMKYLPIIGGVLIVQIIIGYVLVNWIFSPSGEPPEPSEEVVQEAAPVETFALSEEILYDKLDAIVVNPAGTGGLRFLSTEVHLGLSDPELGEQIDQMKLMSKIRDRLIGIFQSKTIDQLEPEHHEALKQEIMKKLNQFLGRNAIISVYFQGFVIQ